jgi:acetate kinase
MNDKVLIVNAGSSSLKFRVYDCNEETGWVTSTRGQVDGLGSSPRFVARDSAGTIVHDQQLPPAVRDGRAAIDILAGWLQGHYRGSSVAAVGHRVVHGGTKYSKPCIVTPQVLQDLRALTPLAPLHQPHNVGAIEAVAERLPSVPQVACFDTAFHRTMPPVAQLTPLPDGIRAAGVQRYGFHGLSYDYIASVLPSIAPEIADARVIVAHLGSGASLCAMKDRKSVENTFGFSPLDGLCMGTRPGSIDPGIVLHMFQTLQLTAADIEKILYKKSGLLALSGFSSDMRDLEHSEDPRAQQAVEYFVYQVTKNIGALAGVLGGLDAIVFTGGIGEHSSEIRRRVCMASAWLGLDLDGGANERHKLQISRPASRLSAWVIPTNEELIIARYVSELLALGQPAMSQ